MPVIFIFLYFLLETLCFWAVASAIGLGWAIVALFVTMFFGMSIAMFEVRRLMRRQVTAGKDGVLYVKEEGAGAAAGNVGLTIAGGLLLSAPGFVTTALGLLLIIPPTRAILRKLLGFGLFRKLENVGARVYQASQRSDAASYGSFGPRAGSPEVIDEDELRQWTDTVDPDDFRDRK